MSGIRLKEIAAASIPTPAAGTVTVFCDVATGEPSYKDDTGAVTSLQGTGFADGDYGDIVISAGVTAINIDAAILTTAARTVTDDATVAAMVDTLGGGAATGTGVLVRASAPTLTNPIVGTQTQADNSTKAASTAYVDAYRPIESLIIAVGDETTAITTGDGKVTFRMPYAFTLVGLPRASLTTDSSSGTVTIDITEGGTTILGTLLTIDASEKTSTTATPCTVADAALADDAEMKINIDGAGTGAAGLKVTLIGRRT